MEPVAIPADPSRESWERLAQFWMAQAMAPTGADDRGLTPLEVAAATWSRLESAFAAAFPGEDFPLERIAPTGSKLDGKPVEPSSLSGGVGRTGRQHWFVAAMPRESNGVTLAFDVPAEELASIASTYDPKWRPASVIRPDQGPSHWTGEFDRFIPAKVAAAQFDGYFLWLLAEESYEGALKWLARDGARQRSISWWPELPEADGESYLIHCALLTGEQPAIPNMKPLDEFFAESEGVDAERIAALSDVPSRQLSVSAPTISEEPNMSEKNTTATEPEEPTIAEQVAAGMQKALSALGIKSKEAAAEPSDPVEPTEPAKSVSVDDITAAITAGLAPIADQVKTLSEGLQANTKAAAEALKARVASELDRLVQSRRLSPPIRDVMLAQLTADGVSEASVNETLAKLAAAPAVHSLSSAIPIETDEGTIEYTELPAEFRRPAELGGSINPEHAKVVARAHQMASAESDPAKARSVFNAEIRRGFGAPAPSTNFLNVN